MDNYFAKICKVEIVSLKFGKYTTQSVLMKHQSYMVTVVYAMKCLIYFLYLKVGIKYCIIIF